MSEEVKDGDNGEGAKEFDASAFTGSGIVDSADADDNSGESKDDSNVDGNSNDDESSFEWTDNYTDDNKDNEDENKDADSDSDNDDNHDAGADSDNETDDTPKGDGSTDDNNADADDNKDLDNPPAAFDGSLTDEHFTAFAAELGLKATSLDELKQGMLDLEAENKRLQESAGSSVTNKKIDSLQTYLKLDNRELLEKDLMARGLKGDDLQEALDTMQDNGMLKIEATKVRNAINGSIENERSSITQSARDEDAKQLKAREDNIPRVFR